MTSGPFDPDDPDGSSSGVSSDEPPPSAGSPGPPARPGLTTFTIEGRAAPGLFVVGWLAVLSGLGLMVIGILGSSALFFYLLGPTMLTIGLVAASGNQALERRARGFAYAGPSPWLVLGAIIAAVYAVGAAVSLGLNLFVDPGSIPNPVINLVAIAIQAIVYAGVIRLAVVGSGGLSWRDMGWRRLDRDQLRHLGFGAALAIPVIAVTNLVAVVLVNALNQLPESPLPPTGTTSGLAIQLIAGAVIAPIAEEMVFRGFALSAWERTVGATGAIVRSSLMFALAHVIEARGDTFGQVLALIAIGFLTRVPVALVLGWVFVRTRSIWAPIGLHMAFNGFLLVLAEYALRNGLG